MVADQQKAIDLLGEEKAVGRWTDYGDLRRYGWIEEKDRDPVDSMAQDALEEGGVFKELSIDADQDKKVRVDHSQPEVIDGKEYTNTGRFYQSLFNVNAGLIVGDENRSPRMAAEGWPADDYVPLKQWSDVVFLLWQRIAGSNPRGEGDSFSDWDSLSPFQERGGTFRPNSQEYYALLGTQLGVKTVSEITVFGADSDASLYFKIDSVQ
ncbi:hypothetical protein BDV10DRAFT_198562 [Aspergillus recurvatus]